jgi:hypothetical protein
MWRDKDGGDSRHQQHIAVRQRCNNCLCTDDAAGACFVLDYDGVSDNWSEPVKDAAGKIVG